MRDLILLDFVHLGIPTTVSNLWDREILSGTHVSPSYSNIGSQPMASEQVGKHYGHRILPKFVGPLAGTILPLKVSEELACKD